MLRLACTLLAVTLSALAPPALAAPGALDTSFGDAGTVVTSFPGFGAAAHEVLVQPDGKLLAVGSGERGERVHLALARYLGDGSLDPGFGVGGRAVLDVGEIDDVWLSASLQPDGKIVVAATEEARDRIVLVRVNADGTLDTTFGASVRIGARNYASDLELQPDGKIVVAAFVMLEGTRYGFGVARLSADGTLDTGFSRDGVRVVRVGPRADLITPVHIAFQPDGKIVVAGTEELILRSYLIHEDFLLVRLNPDGSTDRSFGGDGKVRTDVGGDWAGDVAVQPDGKILVSGSTLQARCCGSGLLRYNPDGTLDRTFGGDGKVSFGPYGRAQNERLVLQPDGKIVVSGGESPDPYPLDFAVARVSADGTVDRGFDVGGRSYTDVTRRAESDQASDVALQPDGRIVVAGWTAGPGYFNPGSNPGDRASSFALARYRGGDEPSARTEVELRHAPKGSDCPRRRPCRQSRRAATRLAGSVLPPAPDAPSRYVLLDFEQWDEIGVLWSLEQKRVAYVPPGGSHYDLRVPPRALARGLWRVQARTPATAATKRGTSAFLFLRVR